MVSDKRRLELNLEHFRGQAKDLNLAYTCPIPNSRQKRLRNRLALALATLRYHLVPGSAILDLGCGPGRGAVALSNWGYKVTAVDLIEEMTRDAEQTGAAVHWIHQPFEEKLLPRRAFDAVLCLAYLEYQERAGKELVRMGRRLKPGGLLLLSVPNTLASEFGFGLTRAVYRWGREPENVPIRHSFTPERLQRFLGMAGFIMMDYRWLPAADPITPLAVDRERSFVSHRLKERLHPEMLVLARTYRPEDTTPLAREHSFR